MFTGCLTKPLAGLAVSLSDWDAPKYPSALVKAPNDIDELCVEVVGSILHSV
jgi:hypothetical protein